MLRQRLWQSADLLRCEHQAELMPQLVMLWQAELL